MAGLLVDRGGSFPLKCSLIAGTLDGKFSRSKIWILFSYSVTDSDMVEGYLVD